jgi:hypothetical protein
MITAIIGKPGSGKSLQLVRICRKAFRNGRDVYSNIVLDVDKMKGRKKKGLGECYFWNRIDELKYMEKGLVAWDEIGSYFDSRSYAKFPPDVRVKFQQYRKDGLDIFYTSQAWSRVDLIVRQLTNIVIECTSIFGVFYVREWYPEEYEKPAGVPKKFLGQFAYFGHKGLYSIYDTFQSVNRADKGTYKFRKMETEFESRNRENIRLL